MTHTYAILDVPGAVYTAVRTLLAAAGYEHAFHRDKGKAEVIDLHGLALRARPGSKQLGEIVVGSLLSRRDNAGKIEIGMNGEFSQLDLDKAREVVGMLQGAIEAAISDQVMYEFLQQKIGMPAEAAANALAVFREMRQGSRDTVNPH